MNHQIEPAEIIPVNNPQVNPQKNRFHLYQEYLNSGHWKRIRAYRIKIDDGKCTQCGSTYFLQVHHLKYADDLRTVSVQDLRTLCKFCHDETHGKAATPEWIKSRIRASCDHQSILEKPKKHRGKRLFRPNEDKSKLERQWAFERKQRADRDKMKFGTKGWAPISKG